MFKPHMSVQIIDEACVGCKQCINVCPSGALEMQGKLAVLEEPRCIGCMKCVEQCIPFGAIAPVPNTLGQVIDMPEEGRDRAAEEELCAKARLDPDQVVCVCTGLKSADLAAGVLSGLTEPEDIVMATGIRAMCGWLCLTPMTRMLELVGNEVQRPESDYRLYNNATKVAIWNIPDLDAVDEKYPEYALKDSLQAIEEGRMNEPAPWLPDIQPGK